MSYFEGWRMEKAFEHEFFPVTIMYDNVARKTQNVPDM